MTDDHDFYLDDPEEWPDPEDHRSDPIRFFSEEIDFELDQPARIIAWVRQVIEQEEGILTFLNIIFCTDSYLHRMNVEYLQHDTLTDIITFPYQDPPRIEGDIFISIDRVHDNAKTFGVSFEYELNRVIIHGVLHLAGYGDKTPAEKKRMTEKENAALALLPQ